MAKKTGGGGKQENFDENTGRYIKEGESANIPEYSAMSTADLKKRQEIELPQVIRLPDEVLPRSLSAKWINHDIAMPDGTVAHFVEGSKLHNIQVFAGKGTRKPIRDAERLVKKYGGKAEDWQKVKGIGTIVHKGEEGKAEVHWYQNANTGKKEIKFKRYI